MIDGAVLPTASDQRRDPGLGTAQGVMPLPSTGERQMTHSHMNVLFAGCAVAFAGVAHGQVMQIDLDSITTDAGGSFGGTTHTGTLAISGDANSTLVGILVDGSPQAFNAGLGSLQGTIMLDGGNVVGGSFIIDATDGTQYLATINDGVGAVHTQAGQGFRIDGLTFAGAFNSNTFAGVDVSAWSGNQLDGSFLLHGYGPDGNGVDSTVDFETWVTVPAPASAGLLALGGLFAARRRR